MQWTITIEGTDEFGAAHRSGIAFKSAWTGCSSRRPRSSEQRSAPDNLTVPDNLDAFAAPYLVIRTHHMRGTG